MQDYACELDEIAEDLEDDSFTSVLFHCVSGQIRSAVDAQLLSNEWTTILVSNHNRHHLKEINLEVPMERIVISLLIFLGFRVQIRF